jgi:hypothetical protein
MRQFGASLTYDTSSVNYDRNVFIILATGLLTCSKAVQFFNNAIHNSPGAFTVKLFTAVNIAIL